jgi:hypothetical protein
MILAHIRLSSTSEISVHSRVSQICLENGEWGVGSGEWGVGSGEWGVGKKDFHCLLCAKLMGVLHHSQLAICKGG